MYMHSVRASLSPLSLLHSLYLCVCVFDCVMCAVSAVRRVGVATNARACNLNFAICICVPQCVCVCVGASVLCTVKCNKIYISLQCKIEKRATAYYTAYDS